jgi:hypothetical protein
MPDRATLERVLIALPDFRRFDGHWYSYYALGVQDEAHYVAEIAIVDDGLELYSYTMSEASEQHFDRLRARLERLGFTTTP